ncbi:MAG: peptidoglycan-binding domain-containing protein [Roseburia inulinivorans]
MGFKLNSVNPVKGSGTNNDILREGSKGAAVVKLQQRLISLGYNCGASGADGNYGKNTSSAVIKFQRINGLKTDGIAIQQHYRSFTRIQQRKMTVQQTPLFIQQFLHLEHYLIIL